MANDVEQLDLSNVDKDNLIDEVSEFDRLVLTDTDRLYGIEGDKRKPVTKLGHVVLEALSIATGSEVERLAPPAGAGRQRERGQGGRDIEARIQRAVTEAVRQALAGRQEREQQLQEEIERLRQEIERLQKPLHERLDEAFGDNWVPRQEGIAVARRGNDGFMEDGWTTDSQPYEKEGKWYIRIKKDNNEEEAELASLSRVPETPPPADEAAQRQQQRDELETRIAGYEGVNLDNLYQTYRGHLQNAANTDEREAFANDATREAAMAQIRSQEVRDYVNSMNQQQRDTLPANAIRDLTAWIEVRDAQEPPITPATEPGETPAPAGIPEGSRPVYRRRGWFGRRWDQVRRRPAREYVATGVYAPPEGGYVRVVDEEVVEVPPSEVEGRDTTARVLGGLALIGVAAWTVHELLEHKYLGHSPTREMRNNGAFPYGHFRGFPGHHHMPGHEAGGPGLNNGTHTDWYDRTTGHRRTGVEDAGRIRLVGQPGDKHLVDGNKVLLGGRKVEWDKTGLLSRWDRMKLRSQGYHVGWGRLQDTLRGLYRYKSIVSKQ